MTTLTADELQDIRDITGAQVSEFSDVRIQTQYDLATTDAPDSTMTLPFTYVYILRRLWGIRSFQVDRTTDHGDRMVRSQLRESSKLLLDYWERYTGLTQGTLGTIQVGVLDLGIDYEQEDFDAEFEVSDE